MKFQIVRLQIAKFRAGKFTAAKIAFTALILTLLILGHKGAQAEDIPTPAGLQKGVIKDPVFQNMPAFDVFYPKGWHFEGKLLQGTTCKMLPYAVFRAASPDGLTVMEKMPRVDLVYGNNPNLKTAQNDCLKIAGPMSAKDYLRHLAQSMHVDYVSDAPVPQELIDQNKAVQKQVEQTMAAKYKNAGMQQPTGTTDFARAIIRYQNGAFTIKGIFKATMTCTTVQEHVNPRSPLYATTKCMAEVRYEHAPEAKYQAMVNLLTPQTGGVPLIPWMQAWTANNDAQTAHNIAEIQRQGATARANTVAQGEQFRESQAVRQRQHDEFDATLRQGTQASIHQTQAAGAARQTAASDMVDYALDRQTLRDPTTGQITKASSAYSYTWIDPAGKVGYQTNDPNANPNGSLPGTWTRQTVTHGDGSTK